MRDMPVIYQDRYNTMSCFEELERSLWSMGQAVIHYVNLLCKRRKPQLAKGQDTTSPFGQATTTEFLPCSSPELTS